MAEKGYDIDYYDPRLERESMSEVIEDAKYVVLAVPSMAAPHVLPHLPKDKPLVVATKGMLSDNNFAEFEDWMVVSGPGFADDIKARKETLLTVTDERIKELLGVEYIKFDQTNDRLGVLMCGALKNVYAIKAGFDNLKSHPIRLGHYIDEVCLEMEKILWANGANPATVSLACGRGDVVLTCSPESRNYEFGYKLRENPAYKPEKTVEGVTALGKIRRGEIKVPLEETPIMQKLIEMSAAWS